MTSHSVALVSASEAERAAIQAMARFYVYDMSEYTGWPCPSDGLYECFDLGRYWTDPLAHRLLIEVGGERAGFALIDRRGMLPATDFNVGEFFVLRKFKGRGIGRAAAIAIFDRFPGNWEVMQLPENTGAIQFWRKVVGSYTRGAFAEARHFVPHHDGEMNVMAFNSAEPAAPSPAGG